MNMWDIYEYSSELHLATGIKSEDMRDVVIIGRGAKAKLSLSVPETAVVPAGWTTCHEIVQQRIAGWKRIVRQPVIE
jgi:hypothetical protein